MIHHSKRPILYVDDTLEQRYAMRRILETEGHSVIEAGTAAEALVAMNASPSLAVVDVKLPDMSGYDLSKRLKQINPVMPILQISASYTNPDFRVRGFSGGADAYMAQPVHPSEFIALIRRLLEVSEAEQYLRFLANMNLNVSPAAGLADAVRTVSAAMVPQFADQCIVFVRPSSSSAQVWSKELKFDSLRQAMEEASAAGVLIAISSRAIAVPLLSTSPGFGSIAFLLDKDREYTSTDHVLATDLSQRAGLALQNCVLIAAERSTRAALIQSEKLAAAGRLSAAIAHEINNPLEALVNLIYLIQNSPEASDSIREVANTASVEVSRLAHVTRQSLGFYREQSAPSALDLTACALETLRVYEGRLRKRHIVVNTELSVPVPILGLTGEIRQVISNLLLNALESGSSGGFLSVQTKIHNDMGVLTISDNGVGIPPEVLPKIFEPFFTTKQGTGTGLGLWISQSIIEKHGGSISVQTSADENTHGTTFTVEFPLRLSD